MRDDKVALLFTTCSGVVEPLMGSRGTEAGVPTVNLFVDDSGVPRTAKS